MADPIELPGFCGGFSKERSITFDNQRTINLYPISGNQLSLSQKMLMNTPGQKFVLNLGTDAVRGELKVGNRLYVAIGNLVFQVDQSYGFIQATGILNTTAGLVQMEFNNNNQIGIVDGVNLYILDISNLLAPILSTITINIDGRPSSICFLNQRFIISIFGTQEFQWSDINDGTSWGAIDKDFATQYPDKLIACVAINGQLLLMKESNVEIWLNNPALEGVIDFIFNYSGTILPYGLINSSSYKIVGNNVVWVTSSQKESVKVVYTTGSGITTISTPAVEAFISTFADISTCFTLVSNQRGNDTFIVSFPNFQETLCYDFQQQEWHERADYNLGYWAPLCIASFGTNKEVCGDANGNLYELDPNTYTDGVDQHPLVKVRITPHYYTKGLTTFVHSLQILFEQGVGTVGESNIDLLAVPYTIYLSSSTNRSYGVTINISGILSEPLPSSLGQPGNSIILYSSLDNTYWKLGVIDPPIIGNPGILIMAPLTPPQSTTGLMIKDVSDHVWVISAITGGILSVSSISISTPPQVGLEISRDGGKTYGNKYIASMGYKGEYISRSIFNGLGGSKDWVYKVSISDAIPVAMIAGLTDMEKGTA